MHRLGLALLLAAILAAPLVAGAAGQAHQHGTLGLDIAVDAGTITLQLQAPLDSVLGFERSPRDDAERRHVERTLGSLKAAPPLFRIDPAGGCGAATVALSSAALGLGDAAAAAKDEHADLEASYRFDCKAAARAAFIDTSLFETFAGVQRIEVQVAGATAQLRRTLRRPASRIALMR